MCAATACRVSFFIQPSSICTDAKSQCGSCALRAGPCFPSGLLPCFWESISLERAGQSGAVSAGTNPLQRRPHRRPAAGADSGGFDQDPTLTCQRPIPSQKYQKISRTDFSKLTVLEYLFCFDDFLCKKDTGSRNICITMMQNELQPHRMGGNT